MQSPPTSTPRALLLAALTASFLAACPCDDGFPDLYYDSLQARCDGLPCGWTAEAGDVAQVATFHSAERGLRLALLGRASRELPDVSLPGATEDGAMASLLVACDPTTALLVEVELEIPPPSGTSGAPERVTLVARLEPDPDQAASDPLVPADLPLVLANGEPVPAGTAVRIVLAIDGPGVCTVDELHLVGARAFTCYG